MVRLTLLQQGRKSLMYSLLKMLFHTCSLHFTMEYWKLSTMACWKLRFFADEGEPFLGSLSYIKIVLQFGIFLQGGKPILTLSYLLGRLGNIICQKILLLQPHVSEVL